MGDPIVLFFLLGVFARLVRSDLRLPEGLYDILAFYLLLAIGLKGGVELSRQPLVDVAPQVVACIGLGLAIPFLLVPVLRALRFNRADSASIAGHYGSVSVVTFAVAAAFVEKQGLALEAHAALWVALMEAPGLVTAIFLARWPRHGSETTPWGQLGHDVFLGKSVLLLVGGLIIGAVVGEAGVTAMKAVFVDPFKGVLALFLLELGLVVGDRLPGIRRYGLRPVSYTHLTLPTKRIV